MRQATDMGDVLGRTVAGLYVPIWAGAMRSGGGIDVPLISKRRAAHTALLPARATKARHAVRPCAEGRKSACLHAAPS